jgi:hypothetical protein
MGFMRRRDALISGEGATDKHSPIAFARSNPRGIPCGLPWKMEASEAAPM